MKKDGMVRTRITIINPVATWPFKIAMIDRTKAARKSGAETIMYSGDSISKTSPSIKLKHAQTDGFKPFAFSAPVEFCRNKMGVLGL